MAMPVSSPRSASPTYGRQSHIRRPPRCGTSRARWPMAKLGSRPTPSNAPSARTTVRRSSSSPATQRCPSSGTHCRASSQIGQRSGRSSNRAPHVSHRMITSAMMPIMDVLRYVAFSARPDGGNPAGVVLDASGLSDERMLEIAAEVGYSETAFVNGDGIRYFSPLAEVPFCGHATVATAVALAERDGPGHRVLSTRSGPVPVTTRRDDQGRLTATLTSVPPRVEAVDDADVDEVLAALRWT